MTFVSEALKGHTHHMRRMRSNATNRYECLDCGKRLRHLVGVVIEKPERYYDLRTNHWQHYLEHVKEPDPFAGLAACSIPMQEHK